MHRPAGHVLIAPDKFKGSLTAREAAARIAAGLAEVRPDLEYRLAPVADGGDGTVDAALGAGYLPVVVTVSGPTGEPLDATFAVRGRSAVVELAAASGLTVLPGALAPMTATSRGTGELIRAALDRGCTEIVLGLGGSASTDGGAGMLQALGASFRDAAGEELGPGGAALADLARVDLSGLDHRLPAARFVVASDVDNPLSGPSGAAAVYGEQKGADDGQRKRLDSALRTFAAQVGPGLADAPGAGAAGGVGFAALAVLHARFQAGIDVVLDLIDFERQVDGAALVVTGEGRVDAQTARGKAPAGVAAAAARALIPVVAFCGRCDVTGPELAALGIRRADAILDLQPDPVQAMAQAGPLLEQLARVVGPDLFTLAGLTRWRSRTNATTLGAGPALEYPLSEGDSGP